MLKIKYLLLFVFTQLNAEFIEKEFRLTNGTSQEIYYKYVSVFNGQINGIKMTNCTSSGDGILQIDESKVIKSNGFMFGQENLWGKPIVLFLTLNSSEKSQVFQIEPDNYIIKLEDDKFILKFDLKEEKNIIKDFLISIPKSIKAYLVWLKSKFNFKQNDSEKSLPDKKYKDQ